MKREAQIEQHARVISSLAAQWRHGRSTEVDFELAIRHALSIFHDEISESAEGQRAGEKYGIDVWSMSNGFPEEWVVAGPDGVISHHEKLEDAEAALAAVERARQP